jgi:tRNA(Ile)-lysidine synthase
MHKILSSLSSRLKHFNDARRWIVAYSGGLDSHVLLHLLKTVHQQFEVPRPALLAFHVNHGINPCADDWEQHCQHVADQLGVAFSSVRVHVPAEKGLSLEESARDVRYRQFAELMQPGDLLLLAHHLDDQIETLMQRLLRGSGVSGLGGMPDERVLSKGLMLRPLLEFRRVDLEAYAEACRLEWIEDDSNDDERFDRNFLRHKVFPLVEQRWPSYRSTLGRVIEHAREASELLVELAGQDLSLLKYGAFEWGGYRMSIAGLQGLNRRRQKNLLRYWFEHTGIAIPSTEQLHEILSFIDMRADACPLLCYGDTEVRRYKDNLVFMPRVSQVFSSEPCAIDPGASIAIAGVGHITLTTSAKASGLQELRIAQLENYSVRFRCGGERCQPAGRQHSQLLKKLLQEWGVPPWWRDRIPLLYSNDVLIAVGDLWVCEGFVALPDQPAVILRWNREARLPEDP